MRSFIAVSTLTRGVRRQLPVRTLSFHITASCQQQRAFSLTSPWHAKRFTESHEWIDLSQDGKTYTIGISNYASTALGDVVYIELPTAGDTVTAGEALGTVESVKSASDVLSPVTGVVSAVNSTLEETPGDLSGDPEGEGWLVKVEKEGNGMEVVVDELMSEETYRAYADKL